MDQEQDLYAILHLTPSASQDDIRNQYKRMVRIFHPDQHQGDQWCEEQLLLCNKAYAVLGDAAQRRQYDDRNSRPSSESLFNFTSSSDSNEIYETGNDNWSFETPEHPRTTATDKPIFSEFYQSVNHAPSVTFGQGLAGPSWPIHAATLPKDEKKQRTNKILIGSGIGASLAALLVILATGNQAVKHLAETPATSDVSTLYAQQISDVQSHTAVIPVPDLKASAVATKTKDDQTKISIAPYWTRYEHDQLRASRAIQEANRRTLISRKMLASRDILNDDTDILRETSTEIQDQFDDLTYGVDSADLPSAKNRLSGKLADYELEISDVQALYVLPAKVPAKASHLVMTPLGESTKSSQSVTNTPRS